MFSNRRVRLWGGNLSPQLNFDNPDKVGVKFPLILSCSDTYMFLQLLTDGSNRNSSYYQTIILSDRVSVAEEPKQKCRQEDQSEVRNKPEVVASLGTLIMHYHLKGQYFQIFDLWATDILFNNRSYTI